MENLKSKCSPNLYRSCYPITVNKEMILTILAAGENFLQADCFGCYKVA
jgi:hypothetical protein